MSSGPISHSADLRRLVDRGYEVSIREGYLLVSGVPYATDERKVGRGVLVSKLVLADDVTLAPDTHVVYFIGSVPCDAAGTPLSGLVNQSAPQDLGGGLVIDHTFSAKPDTPNHLHRDYFDQITSYIAILGGPAAVLDSSATAQTFKKVQPGEDGSPFVYLDTATSRAEIGAVQEQVAHRRIGIVGLGGTGSYILDFVAKAPVDEIHLFDADVYGQHNAFRAPGATPVGEFGTSKAEHWASVYGRMRTGLVPHGYVTEDNLSSLDALDYVFVSMDPCVVKRSLVARLVANEAPFVDVGMGVAVEEGGIGGLLRTSPSTREEPIDDLVPIENAAADDYRNNVQIVELNALNAALAVIVWKKHAGFYRDLGHERESVYLLDTNDISNARPG